MENDRSQLIRIACVQTCSGRNVDRNIANTTKQIIEAVENGAQFVLTPEVTNLMEENNQALRASVGRQGDDKAVKAFSALAKSLQIHLLIGSLGLRDDTGEKLVNRSMLFLPDGSIGATYDKIHMFDVDLGGGETYRESANYTAGEKAVVADLPFGKLGLSICYDVRFAGLYRTLAKAGAQMIAVPAAFTKVSGQAHWHVLLRARAIETGCFIFAPGQAGLHENGRETYGHSLIISPWGEVLAEGSETTDLIYADIDLEQVDMARGKIPALQHDRVFSL